MERLNSWLRKGDRHSEVSALRRPLKNSNGSVLKKVLYGFGTASAIAFALIYFMPVNGSQIVIRGHDGRVVSTVPFNGIQSLGGGVVPHLSSVEPLPTNVPSPAVLGFNAGFASPHLVARYHVVIRDKQGRVTYDGYAPSLRQQAWYNSLLSPEDAWATACTNCTTTAGANRLLGLFEGGVNVTAESEGNTASSGTTFSHTVTNPMIVPGSVVVNTGTINAVCTDLGNGTCSGTGMSGTASTINYTSGALALTYSATLTGANAVTATYKQFENAATCTIAQLSATGQGCWFVGLMTGNGAPTFATADTMASHSGWTEVTFSSNATGGVTQAARPIWTGSGTPSAGSDSNASSVVTYNSGTTAWSSTTADLEGIFLVDNSGSSSTTAGTLDGEINLASGQPIGSSYTIQVTATLSITAG